MTYLSWLVAEWKGHPQSQDPICGALMVTCWGIFLAEHHLNRCRTLLGCFSSKSVAQARHLSKPEQTPFVLENAQLPATTQAHVGRKSQDDDDGNLTCGRETSLMSNLDSLWLLRQ